jgi:hypothetical protein
MNLFDYALVVLAVLAVAGRIALFLPRSPKSPYRAI